MTTEPFRPVLRTQADLERAWTHLMSPLGFGRHSVWLMPVDTHDRPCCTLTEIEDCEQPPNADQLANFGRFARELLDDVAPGGRWAFLLSRPGDAAVSDVDRAWARGLLLACRDAGVRTDVVHLATDVAVVPLPLDELAMLTGVA